MGIVLEDIAKAYMVDGRPMAVLDGVSAEVGPGEFVCLIGPSGCGKSTLFNIICGLAEPDRGRVLLNGQKAAGVGEFVSYMPQKDLLLPWRSLLDNVIIAREIDGVKKETARQEARDLMHLFGLSGFESSYPAELSGGMRQRAALMRTVLARRPVLLLDEPFGALDAITRTKMQLWLLDIWANFRQSVFFVTHDIDEAILLSNRIYVLTPRPARVSLHLEVDLPRPRHAEVVTDPKFLALKKVIMEALLE